mgnify:FL=1
MQPSCFFWNFSHMAGATSSGAVWVFRSSTPNDAVAGFEVGDSAANLFDDAHRLVSFHSQGCARV